MGVPGKLHGVIVQPFVATALFPRLPVGIVGPYKINFTQFNNIDKGIEFNRESTTWPLSNDYIDHKTRTEWIRDQDNSPSAEARMRATATSFSR